MKRHDCTTLAAFAPVVVVESSTRERAAETLVAL